MSSVSQNATTQQHIDHASERIVLGAAMIHPDVVSDLIDQQVTPDVFHHPAHTLIWQTILEHFNESHPVDPTAIAGTLAARQALARLPDGGTPYLHTLIAAVPTAANATYHARRIVEAYRVRRIVEAAMRITQLASSPDPGGSEKLADTASQILYDAVAATTSGPGTMRRADDLVAATFNAIEAAAEGKGGLPTGLVDLDAMLGGGFRAGQFIIVAGRPAMGKSVLGLNVAINSMVRNPVRVEGGKPPAILYHSVEMPSTELMMRVLADLTSVPYASIRSGQLSDNEWAKLATRSADLSNVGLWIDENPHITIQGIRARARRLAAQQSLLAVVVDYLQLVTPTGRSENRQQEVATMSRGLKLLATELGVPVIVLAQLNRNPESRADHTPMLSDLRESGSLEQDADVVLLLHRPDYYDANSPRVGEADIIVAKNRGGKTGTIPVAAQLHVSRFVSLANLA